MLESLSMYSDELMEMLLGEEEVTEDADPQDRSRRGDRPGVHAGLSWASAYQEQGRAATDGRDRSLPAHRRSIVRTRHATRTIHGRRSSNSTPDPNKPFVGMAFKIVEDEFGQLPLRVFTRARLKRATVL